MIKVVLERVVNALVNCMEKVVFLRLIMGAEKSVWPMDFTYDVSCILLKSDYY